MGLAVLVLGVSAYLVHTKGLMLPDFMQPAELLPLRAPKMTELPEFKGEHANDLLWGSYRSGLYFGMRTRCGARAVCVGRLLHVRALTCRSPKSLVTGLMWFDPDSPDALMHQVCLRSACPLMFLFHLLYSLCAESEACS